MSLALPLIMGGASLASSLFSGSKEKKAREKYAQLLESQEKTLPRSLNVADQTYSELAETGLQGYEGLVNKQDTQTAKSIEQIKNVVSSPSDIKSAFLKLQENEADNLMNLDISDAEAKGANRTNYAKFLTNVKAPQEQAIENFNIEKNLAAARERMLGDSAMSNSITQGISGGLSSFGAGLQLEDMKSQTSALSSYFNEGSSGGTNDLLKGSLQGTGFNMNIDPNRAISNYFKRS